MRIRFGHINKSLSQRVDSVKSTMCVRFSGVAAASHRSYRGVSFPLAAVPAPNTPPPLIPIDTDMDRYRRHGISIFRIDGLYFQYLRSGKKNEQRIDSRGSRTGGKRGVRIANDTEKECASITRYFKLTIIFLNKSVQLNAIVQFSAN